jgi:hypothetical protein
LQPTQKIPTSAAHGKKLRIEFALGLVAVKRMSSAVNKPKPVADINHALWDMTTVSPLNSDAGPVSLRALNVLNLVFDFEKV